MSRATHLLWASVVSTPASLHPELGLWKARGLPSLTASAPQVQGEKQTLRWQEGLEQRFHHERRGTGAVASAPDRLPDAPASPRGSEAQAEALAPTANRLCSRKPVSWGPGRPTAKNTRWGVSSGWHQIRRKGSSIFPHCLPGSQQVQIYFDSTFFSSPIEASPSPTI